MRRLYLDTETYSDRDLRKVGSVAYGRHCRLLCITWALEDEPVQLWEVHTGPMPRELHELLHARSLRYVAHNVLFDRNVLGSTVNPDLYDPTLWECTASMARFMGLPGGLDKLCQLFKVDDSTAKSDGKEGLKLFTGMGSRAAPWEWWEKPEEWERFMKYAVLDTAACREVHRLLYKGMLRSTRRYWDEVEREHWLDDQRINDRGLGVDRGVARVASSLRAANRVDFDATMSALTGGEVTKAASPKMQPYLAKHYGVELENAQRATLDEALDLAAALPEGAVRIIACRRESAYSSLAKFDGILSMSENDPDSRARGGYLFHAAHTGRFSGQAVQPQNLARPVKGLDPVKTAGDLLLHIDAIFEQPEYKGFRRSDVLQACIRSAFVPKKGNLLYVVDYSNIEARIIAWFANALQRLALFRRHDAWIRSGKQGERVLDIYEQTAQDVLGDVTQRQEGKMLELGLGFGMGYEKFAGINGLDREVAREWVEAWREANVEVRMLWKAVETMCAWAGDWEGAAAALDTLPEWLQDLPLENFDVANSSGQVVDEAVFGDRTENAAGRTEVLEMSPEERRSVVVNAVRLRRRAVRELSGHLEGLGVRYLAYSRPADVSTEREYQGAMGVMRLPNGKPLHYLSPARPCGEDGKVQRWAFGARTTFGYWEHLHGGLLVENLVQATARELLVHHIHQLGLAGFLVVGHSHDEVIMEVPAGEAEEWRQRGDAIMETVPEWLDGLPLRVESYVSPRYTKI